MTRLIEQTTHRGDIDIDAHDVAYVRATGIHGDINILGAATVHIVATRIDGDIDVEASGDVDIKASSMGRRPRVRKSPYRDGTVAVFTERGELHTAIRRDFGWDSGQWQVAIHGFRRVTDEFIAEHGKIVHVPEAMGTHRRLALSQLDEGDEQ